MLLSLKTLSLIAALWSLFGHKTWKRSFVVSQIVGCSVILLLSVILKFDNQSLINTIKLHPWYNSTETFV